MAGGQGKITIWAYYAEVGEEKYLPSPLNIFWSSEETRSGRETMEEHTQTIPCIIHAGCKTFEFEYIVTLK